MLIILNKDKTRLDFPLNDINLEDIKKLEIILKSHIIK